MENTTYTKEQAQVIASETRNQIGVKALFMLGAKNLSMSVINNFGLDCVAFTFKISGSKIKYIAILYNGATDLYDIRFVNGRGEIVQYSNSNYSEMLLPEIEKYTGLRTSL